MTMKSIRRLLLPVSLLGLAAAPGLAHAATPARAHRAAPPKPVAVYVGRQLVASGQSVKNAIGKVQSKVPFTIRAPRYLPAGYVAAQLSVTPRQRDVSRGWSTLSYVRPQHGGTVMASSNAFVIDQSISAIPVVGGTRVVSTTVGALPATLHEYKVAGHDILFLVWTDSAGSGYDIVTDATSSHLSSSALARIAASLQ